MKLGHYWLQLSALFGVRRPVVALVAATRRSKRSRGIASMERGGEAATAKAVTGHRHSNQDSIGCGELKINGALGNRHCLT